MSSKKAGLAYGMGLAALLLTVFGFFWLGWAQTVAAWHPAVAWPTLYGAFLALLAATIQAVRRGKALVRERGAPEAYWLAARGRFHAVTALEGVACAGVVTIALVWHRPQMIPMGISLVVGLHFIPLARLFHLDLYYAVAIAIVSCDVIAWIFLPSTAITVSVGATTGTILWCVAAYALVRSRRSARSVASSNEQPVGPEHRAL